MFNKKTNAFIIHKYQSDELLLIYILFFSASFVHGAGDCPRQRGVHNVRDVSLRSFWRRPNVSDGIHRGNIIRCW
jgi:hypothetical protein